MSSTKQSVPRKKASRKRKQPKALYGAKARARLGKEQSRCVAVPLPRTQESNDRLLEEPQAKGRTAAALMTELLEESLQNRVPVKYRLPRPKPANGSLNARETLFERFAEKLIVNPLLTRKIVSFQGSKTTPFYRWLKYKEAFSPELVDYLYDVVDDRSKRPLHVLDPFAGTGTALTRASARGWKATGIELMPVGAFALQARFVADRVEVEKFRRSLDALSSLDWRDARPDWHFPHLRITQDAFAAGTESEMSAYLRHTDQIADEDVRFLFWFACLSVLEEVSHTRKDGQYLRWDHRSGRNLGGKRFDKGRIPKFREAIRGRLMDFLKDLDLRNGGGFSRNARVVQGSCLWELPKLPEAEFDLVLTSPPYCNRYDYTRTYALELAFCGNGEADIRQLRQTLLSATVENKSKRAQLKGYYATLGAQSRYSSIEAAFDGQEALREVLILLKQARDRNELSNNNVPDLVENYFFEMAQVVFELRRSPWI